MKLPVLPLLAQPYRAPRNRTRSPDYRLTPEQLEARGFCCVWSKGPYSRWQRLVDFTVVTQQIELLGIGTVLSEVSVMGGEVDEVIRFRGWPANDEDVAHIFRMLMWHPGPEKKL